MEQIARLVKIAALATEGVSRLATPLDVFIIPKPKNLFDVEVYLIIKFNYKIPDIAWNVQENIKELLDKDKIENVEHINIHVQGVDFED